MERKMGKKKDAQSMLELSNMLEKQTIGEKGKSGKDQKMPTGIEHQNQILMKTIQNTSSKIEEIVETWKALIINPLNANMKAIRNCITDGQKDQIVEALFTTFSHVKDIQDLVDEDNVVNNDQVAKCSQTDKKAHTFIDRDIFSSDSENEKDNMVNIESQCELSVDEEENKTLDKLDVSEARTLATEEKEDTNDSFNCDATETGPANIVDETIYEDCEEDLNKEDGEEYIDEDDGDDSDDGEASLDESIDTESEDDPSWVVSDADSSGSDCEEGKRMTVKDMPKVNFATTNPNQLGKWLSETGPVHLNTMCHCKGACVRNCACRSAGSSCGVRCGCKIDKCKWRRPQEVEDDMYTDEEYKEKLRTKKVLQEISENIPKKNNAPIVSSKAPLVKPVFSTPAPINKPPKTTPENCVPGSLTKPVFCTPAPIGKPSKSTLEDTPSTEVFSTPAYRPPSNLTDSAFLTTTAKKRNMKKLFTESFGPQEL